MSEKEVVPDKPRITAREFLVKFAGDAHTLHTVLWQQESRTVDGRVVVFKCSCGLLFTSPVTSESREGLRNVIVKAQT